MIMYAYLPFKAWLEKNPISMLELVWGDKKTVNFWNDSALHTSQIMYFNYFYVSVAPNIPTDLKILYVGVANDNMMANNIELWHSKADTYKGLHVTFWSFYVN